MTKARVAAVLAASGAIGTAALSCQDVVGIRALENAADSGADTSMPEASPPDSGPDPCTLDPGPAQPPASTEGPSIPTVWLVATAVDFGTNIGGAGLNLDHACTTSSATSSCGLLTATNTALTYDEAQGGDNSARGLLSSFLHGAALGSGLASAVAAGSWSVAFELGGYNGTPDDPAVTVRFAGVTGSAGAWTGDLMSVDGGLAGAPSASRAWVAGNKLVAAFPGEVVIPARPVGGTFEVVPMHVSGATLVADVGQSGGALALSNGTFAGRWSRAEMVPRVFAAINGSATADCTTAALYCSSPDIRADPKTDNAHLECDAFSLAFSLSATTKPVAEAVDAGAAPIVLPADAGGCGCL